MDKQTYEVTERAGGRINGRLLDEGETTVTLTEEEARYELMAGNLRLPGTRAVGDPRPAPEPAPAEDDAGPDAPAEGVAAPPAEDAPARRKRT